MGPGQRVGGGGHRGAFTLIEGAMAAIVLGLLAAATLNTVSAAAAGRQITADRSRGRALAEDLIAEITSKAYAEPSDPTAALGVDAGETSGSSLAPYDDVDDYRGLVESPPKQSDGTALPGLSGWTRLTSVEWVSTVDVKTTAGSDTTIKRITVQVKRGNRVVGTAVSLRTGAWTKALTTGKTAVGSAAVTSVTPK